MAIQKPTFAAMFDQGQVPRIVVVDATEKETLGFSVNKFVVALKEYVEKHFAPVWGTTCKLGVSKGQVIPGGCWAIVLLDSPDAPGAFGYHELTADGLPLSKVFVSVCREHGEDVSMTVSHELVEMLIDPGIQMIAAGPNGMLYAYEVADAVQQEGFLIGGFRMTNFQYPAWFEQFRLGVRGKFDHLSSCSEPFQLRPGGYMPVMKRGRWTQIFFGKKEEAEFNVDEHPRTARRVYSSKLAIRNSEVSGLILPGSVTKDA